MNQAICPDDLLVAAWRGTLASPEARALETHLATCASCRASLALGHAVGRPPDVDADDQSMAERLVARALAPRAVSSGSRRPESVARVAAPRRARLPRWAAVAAALVLTAGVASAALWTARRAREPEAPAVTAPAAHVRRLRQLRPPADVQPGPPTPSARAEAPGPTEAPAGAPLPAALTPARPARVAASPGAAPPPHPSLVPAAPPAFDRPSEVAPPAFDRSSEVAPPAARSAPTLALDETAEALFRAANEARRARDLDAAAQAYRTLQARFPASKEAILSHLSLGDLALGRRQFAEALAQFDAYLGRGAAELGEEALLGKAKALAGLGRTAEERETWRALESRYPSSDYRWRARQRLEELPP